MVWLVNFTHKRLQHMVKFRRHNEHLRTVIVRVLRATLEYDMHTRDVSSQLLKVLGTRCLMYVPYEEFEKVMSQGVHHLG